MPGEPWRALLRKTLGFLDAQRISTTDWTFGGGTALALFLHHRESVDIDIFFTDAQILTFLTPRLNPSVAANVSDYTEGSSFLKLKLPGGEIDFIVAPLLTPDPWVLMELEGIKVRVESPEEIIVKKLFYRAETLRARDVIDTAAVFASRKDNLMAVAPIISSRQAALKRRWERLKPAFAREARHLRARPELIERAPALFSEFLQKMPTASP